VKELFKLRGELSKQEALSIQIIGLITLLALWQLAVTVLQIPRGILPSPLEVLNSFSELFNSDKLIDNLFYSLKINLYGYLEAIGICVPLGFVLGLFPVFREMFSKPLDSIRFLPISALTGLFIAWFGIDSTMKVQFLAFGIGVYLLPLVVQRINEVDQVYCDTVYTLGANKWQTIVSVFIPAVFSKISDDIRVITAVSWTYIIIAELVNRADGGIGSLAYLASRQSRLDKVFAVLLIIIAVGYIQDKLAVFLDDMFFPYKKIARKSGA
jgi:NitT/TauT family transport system permease protein